MKALQRGIVFLGFVAGLSALFFLSCGILSPDARERPLSFSPMPDTVAAVNDSVRLYVTILEQGSRSARFSWIFRDDSTRNTVTDSPVLITTWGIADTGLHLIAVEALQSGNSAAAADSIFIEILSYRPVVELLNDTTISVFDTLSVIARGSDHNGFVARYYWFDNNVPFADSLRDSILLYRPVLADTGGHILRVAAMDDDGLLSDYHTCSVSVVLDPPSVDLSVPAMTPVNDSVVCTAFAGDSFGYVRFWFWDIDSGLVCDTTTTDSLLLRWGPADTGTHTIRVSVMDDDSVMSPVDSATITVALFPPAISAQHDTLIAVYDTLELTASATDTNGTVNAYIWSYSDGVVIDTTDTGCCFLVWSAADTGRHTILVRALDDDSVVSPPDTVAVEVLLCAPEVTAMQDTFVAINDTLIVRAEGSDSNGTITGYIWHIPDRDSIITTGDSLPVVWTKAQLGLFRIAVSAVDDDTLVSIPDTMSVRVKLYGPRLSSMGDTTISVFDSCALRAHAVDSNGTIIGYYWAHDSIEFTDTTTAGTLWVWYPPADTGVHNVAVLARDDDSVWSGVRSFTVTVNLDAPLLQPHADTVVYRTDTLRIEHESSDPNGSIRYRLWDFQADGVWDDSLKQDTALVYSGIDTIHIIQAAVDDDMLMSADTFRVVFRPIPFGLSMLHPAPDTTLQFNRIDSSLMRGEVPFSFAVADSDGMAESGVVYTLLTGSDSTTLTQRYQGSGTSVILDGFDTSSYSWRLVAEDDSGFTTEQSGRFTIILEHLICFAGHSIMAGTGCNSGTGGFRRMILDSMRAVYGTAGSVGAAGPLATTYMSPAIDDKSLSVVGLTARQLYDTLVSYPALNADVWVLMIGVNGHYFAEERAYTLAVIDSILARNDQCHLYVVGALPANDPFHPPPFSQVLSDSVRAALPRFNTMLDTAATSRRNAGYSIAVVDGYTPLAVQDTLLNPDLFVDDLHPNQDGYDILGREIMKVMREEGL